MVFLIATVAKFVTILHRCHQMHELIVAADRHVSFQSCSIEANIKQFRVCLFNEGKIVCTSE